MLKGFGFVYVQGGNALEFPIVTYELLDVPVLSKAYKYLTKPSLLSKNIKRTDMVLRKTGGLGRSKKQNHKTDRPNPTD